MKSKVKSQRSKVKRSHFTEFGLREILLLVGQPFVLLSLVLSAQAATIEGTIVDPGGGAVPGVRVSLLKSHVLLAERHTDAGGAFRFSGLEAGNYRLFANLPGFSAPPADLDLREDETRTVDFKLELSAVHQQVVVSATLGAALTPEIGSSVSVLTGQEIDDRGAQSIHEVLRGVPGLEVNQTGRRGAVTGIFVRGGETNYNLILVDGMEMNQFGGDFDVSPLPVDGVDRIEVIRGPQSALYGSNAVAGVINVVTKKGAGPPRFTVLGEGGTFATRRFSAGATGLTGALSWAFNLARLDTDGAIANDDYRNQSATVSLGYAGLARRQVFFHFSGVAADAGSPGPYGSDPLGVFGGINTVSRSKQNLFGYRVHHAEQISSRFRQVTTGSVVDNDYLFRSTFGDSFSNNLRGVINTRSEITVTNQNFFVAGFEYNREQIRNTFIADDAFTPFTLPRTSLAFFAEDRWNPAARLFLTAGVRVDDIRTRELPPGGFGIRPLLPETSVTKVNPRVSAAFLARQTGNGLGATRLHGSFGTGIRPPNGFELAFTDNPNLKPERSVSFDAGIEQRFFDDRAVLDATYFFNRYEDLIVVLGGSLANLSSFLSDNLANSRAQGAEFSFRIRPRSSLEVGGHYTRLNTSILALDGSSLVEFPFEVGQPLLRRPRNSGGFNATWRRGRLMLNLNGYARGKV
ncbi:MAG: TonB-dependent receptor, partial [Acidobacteria bacterium]|nr:TonB-dependent receptor [Acidobacteriota bacterium]